MAILPFLLVVLAVAFYFTTAEERLRIIRAVPPLFRRASHAAAQRVPKRDAFDDALGARTRWAIVAPALAIVTVAVFIGEASGDGAVGDPATLVAWGANFGPRTTNGEWWRLVTGTFVHSGMFALLVNMAVLVQLGLVLERLVGHLTFALVYIASGVAGSLATLYPHRVAVITDASAAAAGLYGLFLASLVWTFIRRGELTIPLGALKKLAPVAAVFALVQLAGGNESSGAVVVGFLTGGVCGCVLTTEVADRKPRAARLAATAGAVLTIAAASGVPLRGVTDVRPELERVVALEQRTVPAYEAAVEQFKLGRMKPEALAKLIERTIVPEVQAVRARLNNIGGVPPEHQALVADATEYLRLRDESWRLRAQALQKHNMLLLREADRKEQAALHAFERVRPSSTP